VKYLLDASALIPLVTRRGKRLLIEASRENIVTTDLAIYEACNSLWKLASLLKTFSLKDVLDIAVVLKDLSANRIIQTVTFDKLDLPRVLERACKERLTFYDASYIAIAEDIKAILVTEDETLRKVASKYVKTMTYGNLERTLKTGSRS